MKQIKVKVTEVPRAGGTVLLIACSECGPVAVDSLANSTRMSVGVDHLLHVHGLAAKQVGS